MELLPLYQDIIRRLKAADIEAADLEARRILQERSGNEWSQIIAAPETLLTPQQLLNIEADVQRRLAGEPLSRIYGCREFWGMEFALSPDTLDPRPDTETLIEAVLKAYKDESAPEAILDLGTGTGCILLALLKEFPQARGLGIDKAPGAVETAQKNAKHHDLDDRAAFQAGNWGDNLNDTFDLIVSNPPYITNQIIKTLSKEVQNHDPILALSGGNDGLDAYRQIFSQLFSLLKPAGKAFFEIGFDQEDDVARLAEESRIRVRHVHRDLAGQPRVVEISNGDK
ncbi:MAG: peptide chain release factor N(5)-glutamine methyltransferase [Alphaproteobacteria bacterium]|nr:peptide chain release factor N(5)-glutamine methyltransferase [Alphaproteobacteria bacterium]